MTTTTAMSKRRRPADPNKLMKRLDELHRDIAEINKELKTINDDFFLSPSIQPLMISAIRQSGFTADHLESALLILSVAQGREAQR